jgi:diaminopimelate epimerase
MTRFIKMHGCGNDFVILDARTEALNLTQEQIRRIADRRFGVGCDQVIVMEPSSRGDVFMRIYNPDSSESGACGNATRCVASLIMNGQDRAVVETVAGLLPCAKLPNGEITVDMGAPRLDWRQIPLAADTDTLHAGIGEGNISDPVCVNVGNPHAVFFVEDAEAVPIEAAGSKFEKDSLFPERANIEFAQVIDRQTIKARVWERGAGVTLACGSGACAVAVAAVRRGLTDRKVVIHMDGGKLTLEWRESDNHVYMTGPATAVFEGVILP